MDELTLKKLLSTLATMFEHEIFDVYEFNQIPLNTDLYLRDEVFIKEYESSLLTLHNGGKWVSVGVVSPVAARRITDASIDLTWYVQRI